KEARDKYLLFIFVLAASINAGFHILKTKNIPLFGYTVQSGLGNPNVLSHYLELALPMALFLVMKERIFIIRILSLTAMLITLYALKLASTRGAILGIGIGTAISLLIFVFNNLKRRYFGILMILLVITLILFSIIKYERFITRVRSDFNIQVRLRLMKDGLDIFRDNFLTGVGGANFFLHYRYYRDIWAEKDIDFLGIITVVRAHNDHLQNFCEFGFFASAIFYVFILSYFYKGIKLARYNGGIFYFLIVGVIASLVDSFFNFNFRVPVSRWMFFYILGLLASSPVSINSCTLKDKGYKNNMRILILIVLSILLFFTFTKQFIATSYIKIADSLRDRGEKNEALTYYSNSTALKDDDSFTIFQKGLIYEDNKNIQEAVEVYHKVRKIDPYFVNAIYHLGEVFFTTERYFEASKWYYISHRLRSGALEPYLNVAASVYKGIQQEYGTQLFKKALFRVKPDKTTIDTVLKIYWNQGNYQGIKEICLKLLKKNYMYPENISLVLKYAQEKNDILFINHLIEALRFTTSENVLNEIAETLFYMNRLEESERLYSEIIKMNISDHKTYYRLGMINFIRNKFAEAKVYFVKASVLNPLDPHYLYHTGISLLKSGDREGIIYLEKALKLSENKDAKLENIIKTILYQGRTDKQDR
ncbi:MAG: O-antigen ligase family protein, partial [Candidatus Hydrogenedentota bacterium]